MVVRNGVKHRICSLYVPISSLYVPMRMSVHVCAHLLYSVLQLLRRIHHAYVDLTANPFFTFGASIKSERFDSAVEVAVTAFSRT